MTGTAVAVAILVWCLVFWWWYRKVWRAMCPDCDGTGFLSCMDDFAQVCPRCQGSGERRPVLVLQGRRPSPDSLKANGRRGGV